MIHETFIEPAVFDKCLALALLDPFEHAEHALEQDQHAIGDDHAVTAVEPSSELLALVEGVEA